MDVNQALAFADRLLARKTGKSLSDLERRVFLGSWQGLTYRDIHPPNPEYIEKYVAYTLWRKLSDVLEERVTKRCLQGAFEKALKKHNIKRVFISYRGQEPDRSLAEQIYRTLAANEHLPFASNLDAIAALPSQSDPVNLAQTDQERKSCDCFILLVSPLVAVSEIAIEELRQLRHWRNQEGQSMPLLIAILINIPQPSRLSHDLRQYLQGAILWPWHTSSDTPAITTVIQKLLDQGAVNPIALHTNDDAVELMLPSAESFNWLGSESPNLSEPMIQRFSLDSPERSTFNIQHPVIFLDDVADHPADRSAQINSGPSTQVAIEAVAASADPCPLPTAEPELPKGLVRPESTFYIERVPCEAQCYAAIKQPGALIRIKAPRQMGKTSLMARILGHMREQGYQAIPLSFQHADRATFQSLSTLLRWFCMKVARKLRLPDRLDEYWVETFGSKDNCTNYFEDYLLPEVNGPLVLGLDEVDCVFEYPLIADDFFGLLRAWHEEACYGSEASVLWEKLRLVVVHSTEVYIPLNINQSPFNVGLPIELAEFTAAQVSDLAHRHQLEWTSDQVKTLMSLVGGHPYLVRLALYNIAQGQITLDELCRTAPTEAGIYDDHLRRHLWNLNQQPNLASAYHTVLKAEHPIELESQQAFKLHSMGLVHLRGNLVVPNFDLYRQYFGDRLATSITNDECTDS